MWVWVGAPQISEAQVSMRVDRNKITIGDRITLTLQIDFEGEKGIPELPRSAGWAGLEVLDSQTGRIQTLPDGKKRIWITYTLTSFEVGEHQIPIGGFSGGTVPRGTMEMEPIVIQVQSVNPNPKSDDDIYDIRDQRQLHFRFLEYLLPFMFLVVLLALFYLLYRKYIRQKEGLADEAPLKVKRKADEIALERLEQIKQKKLYEQGKIQEYYSEISDCLREYLRNRYGLYAEERTTTEIRAELSGLLKESQVVRDFVDVLSESDFVKFAKYYPDDQSADQIIKKSGDLVVSTAEPKSENLLASIDNPEGSSGKVSQ